MLKPVIIYHDAEKTKIKERYFVDENGNKRGHLNRIIKTDSWK